MDGRMRDGGMEEEEEEERGANYDMCFVLYG